MKKIKHHPTDEKFKATKRKHEDVDNGATKLKKKKKQDHNGSVSIPNKVENNLSSPKKMKNGKTFQATYVDTQGASNAEAVTAKGSKKKKKIKQFANDEKISTSLETVNVNSEVKKKKKKSKLNQDTLSVSQVNDATGINSDVTKKKKKKKKLNRETHNASAVSNSTAVDTVGKKKKKKKKNKLNQEMPVTDDSRSFSSKTTEKNMKSKPNQKEKKAFSEGEGSILEKQKETKMKGSVNSHLFIKKNKSKVDKSQQINQGNPTNNVQTKSQKKSISRLIHFKNKQEGLLSKVSGPKEKKKIELRIRKIEQQIQKLRSGVGNQASKTNTTEVVNQRVFKGLPQDPPPSKKKHKRLELNEFLQNQLKASRFR